MCALQTNLAAQGITADAALTSTTAQAATTSSGGRKLSGGAIAGIVIGCIVFVALVAALAAFLLRRKAGTPWF